MPITEILYSFRLFLEWKTDKEIPESSKLEFLEKCSANNFSYQMQKTTLPGRSIEEVKQNYLC